jgi:hypothetical protein
MRRQSIAIALTSGVAGGYLTASALHSPTAVLTPLALLLLASLGYVWVKIISQGHTVTGELAAVGVGLVLALPVLGGVILQQFGLPLDRETWSVLFAGLTLLGDITLAHRAHSSGRALRVDEHQNTQPRDQTQVTRPDLRPIRDPGPTAPREPVLEGLPSSRGGTAMSRRTSRWQVAGCGLAVLIAVGALWIARAGAISQGYSGFTELWLSSTNHSAGRDSLGVQNRQGKQEAYRLVLRRAGRTVSIWNLSLGPGQTWQRTMQVAAKTSADLYLIPNLSRPYRYVDTGQ